MLSRGRILGAALELVDEERMGALTMRRLGAELGVNPMSIYHHLPGKDAVISGLVDLVFSGMRVHYSDGSSWQDRVRAWAEAYRGLVRSHPNLVLEIVANAPAATQAVLLVNEPLYGALDESGLPPAEVMRAADSVVDFVHGFALAEGAQPQVITSTGANCWSVWRRGSPTGCQPRAASSGRKRETRHATILIGASTPASASS